jgi:hypothetical protein
MHGPACIFWANLTPFSLQVMVTVVFEMIGCVIFGVISGDANAMGQGGHPAPWASQFHRISTRFPLNPHAI